MRCDCFVCGGNCCQFQILIVYIDVTVFQELFRK